MTIPKIADEIRTLRSRLHRIPEPAFHETQTKAMLMDFCSGIPEMEVTDRGEWFYCRRKGKDPENAIAFRADFDAVAGTDGSVGHFCGHDGHAAILAGFGKYLAELPPERTVYLIFQPAEEIGKGAQKCADLLAEKGIREIYGFHNIPGFPKNSILLREGTFACASTGMEITITGAPSHAAYPEDGRNPAKVIAELILHLDAYLQQPHRGVVLGTVIGVELGSSAYGVSAGKGILRLTLRAEEPEEYDQLLHSVCETAKKKSESQGMTCRIRYEDPFPATVNKSACVRKVEKAAEQLGLALCRPSEPFRWSEDFGYYLQKTDGAFFGVGDGETHPQLHTAEYEFPDGIVETVIRIYARLL